MLPDTFGAGAPFTLSTPSVTSAAACDCRMEVAPRGVCGDDGLTANDSGCGESGLKVRRRELRRDDSRLVGREGKEGGEIIGDKMEENEDDDGANAAEADGADEGMTSEGAIERYGCRQSTTDARQLS
jgi:hypothetical protein